MERFRGSTDPTNDDLGHRALPVGFGHGGINNLAHLGGFIADTA